MRGFSPTELSAELSAAFEKPVVGRSVEISIVTPSDRPTAVFVRKNCKALAVAVEAATSVQRLRSRCIEENKSGSNVITELIGMRIETFNCSMLIASAFRLHLSAHSLRKMS